MNTSTIPQLDYAPPRRSRGQWIKRIFLTFLIVSNLYFAFDKWGEGIQLQARMLLEQRKCMQYSQPPTRIVFDSDPSRTAILLSQGYSHSPNVFPSPNLNHVAFYPGMKDAFDAFEAASANVELWRNPPGPNTGAMGGGVFASAPIGSAVFLHNRRPPSGHVRLVECSISIWAENGVSIQLSAMAIESASLTGLRRWCEPGRPIELLSVVKPEDRRWLRLFAGQPDPDNASRFTVRYETTDGNGSIEGMLQDDDSVQLRIVNGPLTIVPGDAATAPADDGGASH